ncbi:MAG: hypothetical protein U1A27_12255 [Phycisphaerae bacterium]
MASSGGVPRRSDHRDPQFYARITRAHEFAERQVVSLLELDGLGRSGLRALWKAGITTADQLRQLTVGEAVSALSPQMPQRRAELPKLVEGWHLAIDALKANRATMPLDPVTGEWKEA